MKNICAIFAGVLLLMNMEARELNLKGHEYVSLKKVADTYKMSYELKEKEVVLKSEESSMRFPLGSRWGSVNRTNVAFIYPVEFDHDPKTGKITNPRIDKMDFKLTLEPLMRPEILEKHSVKLIMIDPGHGGKEPGCMNERYKEKDLNLIYAKKLKAELEKAGYKVNLTRDIDKCVGLKDRADITASAKADLFISLHINALSPFETKARGIENYCMTPAGGCSTNSGKVYGYQHTAESYPGNKHDLNNFVLTYCIQKAMVKATGATDRSARRANFSVLRNNAVPAVLVESGYLTNPEEEKLLVSEEYQDKIVKAVVQGINAYADKVKKCSPK